MTDELEPRLRTERLAIAVVFFSLGFVFASWAGRIPNIKEHLNLSDGQLGLSMFCLAIGSLVSMPVAGSLGTKVGTEKLVFAFSSAFALCLTLIPFATNWQLFSLALLVFGFAMGGQDVSMNAHAVHVERDAQRQIMAAFHGTFSVGAMVGGAFSSLMCALHWPVAMHFSIVTVITFIAILILRDSLGARPGSPSETSATIFALPDRKLLALALVAFCSFIGEGAVSDWSAVYLNGTVHASDSIAAAGFAVFSLAMSICRFFGDKVAEKIGARQIFFWGGLIAAAGISASLCSNHAFVVLAAYACAGIGFSCMVPVAFSTAGRTSNMPPTVAIAAVATLGYFGFVIAPPIVGVVADRFSLRIALWLIVFLSLAITALSSQATTRSEANSTSDPV